MMRAVAILLEVMFAFAYYVLAQILILLLDPLTTTASAYFIFGSCYGVFMIISLGYILESLPKSISKYYENKA